MRALIVVAALLLAGCGGTTATTTTTTRTLTTSPGCAPMYKLDPPEFSRGWEAHCVSSSARSQS